MQILILRSNPISPDPRVEKIAHSLIEDGFSVSALGWDRTGKLPKAQVQGGVHIHRLAIRAKFGTGLMNLPALLAWELGLLGWLWMYRSTYQVIHACDFDTILPALLAKFFWKKIVIYDIFDFYADHLRRTPVFLKQAIRRVDYWAINHADGVILVDDARREQIKGSHPKVCISVYNSPEDVPLPSSGEYPSHSEFSLRIAYVGLLQVERGLFEMVQILSQHPEWHLDLAGFGGDEGRIVASIQHMPNVTWHGRIAYPQALELSQKADVLFATYDPAIANHRYSSPNKVFEAMMLGKPIIVAEHTNMDRIISAANCGMIVKYGDKVALENALISLEKNDALRKQLSENARRAYDEVYTWGKMKNRLKDFYSTILREKRA